VAEPSAAELAGRVALVTGAGRNIGRAIALALAEAGAAVVVNARSSQHEVDGVAAAIERGGGRALAVLADVTDAAAVARMVDAARARFGRLDVLVNNAAVRDVSALDAIDLARWREITGVILDGAIDLAPYRG
jgi:3-oxoacyl-[acyl-carrier protein] reductase